MDLGWNKLVEPTSDWPIRAIGCSDEHILVYIKEDISMGNSICSGGGDLQSITSSNNEFTVYFDSNNGILYWENNSNSVVIAISTNAPQSGCVCMITASGILEIVDASGGVVWWVGMAERGGACLYIQNNGDVQLIATELGTQVVTWQWIPPVTALVLVGALQKAQTGVETLRKQVEALRQEIEVAGAQLLKFLKVGGTQGVIGSHCPPYVLLKPPAEYEGADHGHQRESDVKELRPGHEGKKKAG
jgi:hypothetical protein